MQEKPLKDYAIAWGVALWSGRLQSACKLGTEPKLKALISKAYPKLTDDDYYKIRYEIATSPKALSDTSYSDTEKEAKVLDICNKHPQYKRNRFKIALA